MGVSPKKIRDLNPTFVGHFGDRRQFAVVCFVALPDLLRPYDVACYSK